MIRAALVVFFFLIVKALAVEVDPSKNTVPDKFVDTGGKRFSIFSGDPKRIQRANEINFGDFETKLEVTPNPISLKTAQESPGGRPGIQVSFTIRNKGKRTYTFSFPNAQRYEFIVKNASGQVVYTWSADKEFDEKIGTILVNAGDPINYHETLLFEDFTGAVTPGTYTVSAILNNYPELSGQVTLTVNP